jgi:hypothetical protein
MLATPLVIVVSKVSIAIKLRWELNQMLNAHLDTIVLHMTVKHQVVVIITR